MTVKKTALFIILFLSLVMLLFRFGTAPITSILGIKSPAGIKVLSIPEGAKVLIDNKEVGQTPYENRNLEAKEYDVILKTDQAKWEGQVKLTAGTVSVINRELAPDPTASSGETIELEKGKGATITSSPSGADVEIDGKLLGKTPLSANLSAGTHNIVLSHDNYLKRSISGIDQPRNYSIGLNVDLALSEIDFKAVGAPIVTETKLVVLPTPTGFLRIRSGSSTAGDEIARVSVGDELTLIEELDGWYKVRLPSGQEGYASSQYLQKKG